MVMQDPNLKRLTGIDKSIHDFLPADVPPLLPKVAWYVNGKSRKKSSKLC